MKTVEMYEAFDGKHFEWESDCEEHELKLISDLLGPVFDPYFEKKATVLAFIQAITCDMATFNAFKENVMVALKRCQ